MFTGLIEACVPLRSLERRGAGARLTLPAPDLDAAHGGPWEVSLGESVAVSGCCLTVVELAPDGAMAFDLSDETLGLTWLGEAAPGRVVNLERSLRLGDRLGGHVVSGHVDGLGRVLGRQDPGDGGLLMSFEAPAGFERWLVSKASIAVDGISLTVVRPEGRRFDVALIPETLERTSLGRADDGDAIHLEADPIGKWVEHLVEPWRGRAPGDATPA